MKATAIAAALMLMATVPAAAAAPAQRQPSTGNLFVLTASGGKLRPLAGQRGVFTLVLRNAPRQVNLFGDRPVRQARQESLARFVRRWRARGFADDPPNAALVIDRAPARRDVLMVTLSRPRYDRRARSLRLRARILRGTPTPALARLARRADRRVARRFGRVSLFVDNATSTSTQAGDICRGHLVNSVSSSLLLVTSASKWDTDSWNQEPRIGSGASGGGGVFDWGSDGGNLRGCSNGVSMILRPNSSLTPTLATIELSLTRPFGFGDGSWSCTSSNPARFPCREISHHDSGFEGILEVTWQVIGS